MHRVKEKELRNVVGLKGSSVEVNCLCTRTVCSCGNSVAESLLSENNGCGLRYSIEEGEERIMGASSVLK